MPTRLTSTTAEEFQPRNRLRKSFAVQNEDSAINMFIKRERRNALTVSGTNHDHLLGPGAAFVLNDLTDGRESIEDRWTIVAASGTPRFSFLETEEVVR